MTPVTDARIRFIEAPHRQRTIPFCEAVAEGLCAPRKRLPCRFFYDAAGSRLFERICQLPEYYLTRTEYALLERYAPQILAVAGEDLTIVEFGSGNASKTRLLLDAALERQRHLHYIPIDISADFLRDTVHALLDEYQGLTVTALAAEYADGIDALPAEDGPRLILFLGSNIGNFTHDEAIDFLAHLRRRMQPQDRLLLGVDLLKARPILETAYNDREGVTAQFNKNILARINRELGANFDLQAFDHAAPFIESRSRIEMRLISRRPQTVYVAALEREFTLEEGEFIHTENSHKYSLEGIASFCHEAELAIEARWLDEKAWFALLLLKPEQARRL